ncbi:MAG TPA: sigma-70 family RNA polymerase sigma factor [Syntrophorhabdus sp.]|jgi:RNA polymerase sigma-70 factor (ECF subfamily)|nr:sigma-70 family RNA polymerase sigma factor [Syntrophorhabdus sp.]MDI9557721.1 sigma-70 family RNA polymerase sigma factor [Pseudomonadota bacterium]OPX97242.1 MAG: ECF RNA polymerase sigma-E factor [Syntrophorhabdus sp. PtaB.Bin027]OQB74819.1 MAG: ECF RNA polymerase sigma-E factor [Deltaproteobacteria bacterium ADurb.Bin135]MBP8744436.1 sigma-70 family RNA polymerase sigma factor [Syntrophorhabdus sp.]
MISLSKRESDRNKPQQNDDNHHVSMCQKGDVNAFQVLVERYQKKMLNMAYRMTGDYEEACEITQEAFLSAFKAIRKFRGEASFATWLTRITLNQARNQLKKTRYISHHEGVPIDAPVDTKANQVYDSPASQEETALEQLERKELQSEVQKCIDTLPDEFREVLVLRDIQEFSYDEIRDILGVPEGTIKSRLFRAREAMKNCLKRVVGDIR